MYCETRLYIPGCLGTAHPWPQETTPTRVVRPLALWVIGPNNFWEKICLWNTIKNIVF